MTERTAAAYKKLVREAFIQPIRSVLIVDDDYPILDEVLKEKMGLELQNKNKRWKKNAKEVLEVIEEFRKPKGPYLLDIHDVSNSDDSDDIEEASQLQQTDLLILDYDLDGNNDGVKAMEIAQKALTNAHFNLIIVHTKGAQTKDELSTVFSQFVLGLLSPLENDEDIPSDASDQVKDYFADDKNVAKIRSVFRQPQYLELRRQKLKGGPIETLVGEPHWRGITSELNSNNIEKADWPAFLNHAAKVFEGQTTQLGNELLARDWRETNVPWIRCAKGFIAFKAKDRRHLLPRLYKALLTWRPNQSRLILTKLRAVMNEHGFERQDDALGSNALMGAGWYHALLQHKEKNGSNTTRGEVEKLARSHAEQLLDKILSEVFEYTKELVKADIKIKPNVAVERTFGFKLDCNDTKIRATILRNAFIGSKPVSSTHLELGHILRIKGQGQDGDQYWLCMTPACDLVPGQGLGADKLAHPDYIKDQRRFSAIQLKQIVWLENVYNSPNISKKCIEKINDDRLGTIFANVYEECKTPKQAVFQVLTVSNGQPIWMVMYAATDGNFISERLVRISFSRKTEDSEPHVLNQKEIEAEVCAQLRYEYALNIQSMLVKSMSRIGLGYQRL